MMRGVAPAALAVATACTAALTLAPVVSGAGVKPVTRKAVVGDYYFTPTKMTVRRGSTIAWTWPVDNSDTHDIELKKGPKGVKRFQSPMAAADFTYRRKLTVPGTYKMICTLHEEMSQTITVR